MKNFTRNSLPSLSLIEKLYIAIGLPLLSFTATGDTVVTYRFITDALSNQTLNPWSLVMSYDPNGNPFSYPFGMFLILALLRSVTYLFGATSHNYDPVGALFINIFILSCILVVNRLVVRSISTYIKVGAKEIKRIQLVCLLNPSILVSVFFARQYDIIPTTIVLISFLFLIEKRYELSAIALGISISVKTYPAFLIIPFLIFVLQNTNINKIKTLFNYVAFSVGIPLIGAILFFSESYKKYVLTWPNQTRVFWSGFDLGGVQNILIIPVAYCILISWQIMSESKWGAKQLAIYTASVLGMLTILMPPFVQYWCWIIPFLILGILTKEQDLFTRKVNLQLTLLSTFGFFQLIYANFFHWSFLTQITFWKKYPWPLSEAPIDWLSKKIGSGYAETIQVSIFSIQWAFSIVLIAVLIHQISNSNSKY